MDENNDKKDRVVVDGRNVRISGNVTEADAKKLAAEANKDKLAESAQGSATVKQVLHG